ncbi:hypothetical protein IPP75_01070 [Candidatus Saccharibacteria bacterium]|nr:MAG: hypothetical protein IPP75_01070 [Candidatus Saccharibacteria bacterium]
MNPIDIMYKYALGVFGEKRVQRTKNELGAIDIYIHPNISTVMTNCYHPRLVHISSDGEYYWMSIDDFQWEFDDNTQNFLKTTPAYLDAVKDNTLYVSAVNIGKFKLFKKLEIKL